MRPSTSGSPRNTARRGTVTDGPALVVAPPYRIRVDIRCRLGEGPRWVAAENAVYWVDILAPAVHRLSLPDLSVRSWEMPERIGWLIERADRPDFIAGLQSGFVELTLEPWTITPIVDPEPEFPGNRMNDAKTDAHGRIWAGTMDAAEVAETGSLYCLDTNLGVTRVDSGYRVTNGPAFSPDGATMYHTDSARRTIYAYPMDANGNPGKRREFIRFHDAWGYPDGMTVDCEGHLWVAHWDGGCVSRFSDDGKRERSIKLPASRITSCVFAGPDLDRMFVTSAARGRDDEPDAGKLFEVDPGVRGLPQASFRGHA